MHNATRRPLAEVADAAQTASKLKSRILLTGVGADTSGARYLFGITTFLNRGKIATFQSRGLFPVFRQSHKNCGSQPKNATSRIPTRDVHKCAKLSLVCRVYVAWSRR